MRLTTNVADRVEPGSVLYVGERFLEVTASRPHQGHHLVYFAGVSDRAAAEQLRGEILTADPLEAYPSSDASFDDRDDPVWVHEVVGLDVVDQGGVVRGSVVALEANPASDLLVLDTGALVPIRFITDRTAVRLTVDVPDGLF